MSDKNALAFAIVVGSLLVSTSMFYLGYSMNKNKNTRPLPNSQNGATPVDAVEPQAQQRPEASGTVSIDDDPVLGSREAKVAIVEFSDYECPFCARHSVQTSPQIVEEYVDSGQVMLVYRDTPFHGTGAIQKANAANCVREQLGDQAYFSVKDQIYTVLNTERRNIEMDEIASIAQNLGVNVGEYSTCVQEGRYNDEITKDLNDSRTAGVSGTPSFVIGVVDENGQVQGEAISGAQPYAVFKATIDKYLE